MDMDPVHKIGGAQQEKARRQVGSRQPRLRRKTDAKARRRKGFHTLTITDFCNRQHDSRSHLFSMVQGSHSRSMDSVNLDVTQHI